MTVFYTHIYLLLYKINLTQIWLKDAVQCRSCKMTCHKKCVNKCQATAVCTPCEDDSLAMQGISPAKGPEIVTTEADETVQATDIAASSTPQVLFQNNLSAWCFISTCFPTEHKKGVRGAFGVCCARCAGQEHQTSRIGQQSGASRRHKLYPRH